MTSRALNLLADGRAVRPFAETRGGREEQIFKFTEHNNHIVIVINMPVKRFCFGRYEMLLTEKAIVDLARRVDDAGIRDGSCSDTDAFLIEMMSYPVNYFVA